MVSLLNRNLSKPSHKIQISMLFLSLALLFLKSLILSIDILQAEFDSPVVNSSKFLGLVFLFKFYKIWSKPLNMVTLNPHGFNGIH